MLERENRHTSPPDVSTAWRDAEQLIAMMAVKSHFAAHTRPFLDHGQNVGRMEPKVAVTPLSALGDDGEGTPIVAWSRPPSANLGAAGE